MLTLLIDFLTIMFPVFFVVPTIISNLNAPIELNTLFRVFLIAFVGYGVLVVLVALGLWLVEPVALFLFVPLAVLFSYVLVMITQYSYQNNATTANDSEDFD